MTSRPTDAERVVEYSGQKPTAEAIIAHLREYKQAARIAVLALTNRSIKELETGPLGLTTLYKDELSYTATGGKPIDQMTHRAGGVVRFYIIHSGSRAELEGKNWSMTVEEGIPPGLTDLHVKEARDALMRGLRLAPQKRIISDVGWYKE